MKIIETTLTIFLFLLLFIALFGLTYEAHKRKELKKACEIKCMRGYPGEVDYTCATACYEWEKKL